ncbi:RNase adapter RapZ [Amnibacterium flavum]|uniref:RNase adapter RapZ n=1 Tax=Amnibacterium flavum TaxID=2173173 RepID=A0A2V1HTM1_9MICO|nr:RNase adapter RapZ [Amnibacterium flavum]PVZ94399.1 RNase adapter RapZ [Amnibacterium flavum]
MSNAEPSSGPPAAGEPASAAQTVLVVTGMSGAGRTTAGNALEDVGWYVVDNLPPQMLLPLIDVAEHAGDSLPRIAVIVDVRGGARFSEVDELVRELRSRTQMRVLFLDASDTALVRRFEQVRRPHPLQAGGTLLDGITAERDRTAQIRATADVVVDTSELNVHQLASTITELFGEADTPGVRVTLTSFGHKYGVPTDADIVADARFLPNPFWVPELRPGTGLDSNVSDYVFAQEGAGEFVDRFAAMLEPVLAGYSRENKRHATIAVGCTGGRHRSVALVEELAKRLGSLPGVGVTVRHRDLGRE